MIGAYNYLGTQKHYRLQNLQMRDPDVRGSSPLRGESLEPDDGSIPRFARHFMRAPPAKKVRIYKINPTLRVAFHAGFARQKSPDL